MFSLLEQDTIFSGPEDPGPWTWGLRDPDLNWHTVCVHT